MGIYDFAISTNHPFNKYNAGQTVKGKMHFKLDAAKKVRGVYIKLKGRAKVYWTETRTSHSNGKSSYKRVAYYAEHEYINDRIYVAGEHGGEPFELQPEEYNYKFDYNLPIGLPSSYEGTYGSIRYTVTGILDIPWGFDDEEEVKLEVMSPIDLNSMPYLMRPGHIAATKNLCCLWCKSGPILLELDIPRTGYIHGETIPVRIDIENGTNTAIAKLECKVKQNVTFHSEYPSHHTKQSEITLCAIPLQGIPARSTKTYNEELHIPNSTVLNFNNCNLINIEHVLKVNADIDGCHLDLSANIPITMGSIPLRLGQPSAPPLSILAGLGTPYPYEMKQCNGNEVEASPSYLFNYKVGWMVSPKTPE